MLTMTRDTQDPTHIDHLIRGALRSNDLDLSYALRWSVWNELHAATQEQLARHVARSREGWSFVELIERGDRRLAVLEYKGMRFVLVLGGHATVGSDNSQDPDAYFDEICQRTLKVDPFLIAEKPTTNEDWLRLGGDAIDERIGVERTGQALAPANFVSAWAADEWTNALGLALPSEVQWEYACRAGTSTRCWWGHEYDATRAVCRDSKPETYVPIPCVDPRRVNPWGLYDMSGNILEWCADYWRDSHKDRSDDRPFKRREGDKPFRTLRGGSIEDAVYWTRSAIRLEESRHSRFIWSGLRPVVRLLP